jgi:hypothetical protein
MPNLPGRVDDYEEWVKAVWPAYVAAADSGEPFTISQIAADKQLPDPPRPQAQWGQLPGRLKTEGLIEEWYGRGNPKSSRRTAHKSRVAMWIGIPAHRRAEAAA